MGLDVSLVVYSDCGSLVEYLQRQQMGTAVTSSRRLEIDLEVLREAIALNEIDFFLHCPGVLNQADNQTKWDIDSAAKHAEAVCNGVLELPCDD